MKPKAYELLQNAKSRAFQQIQYALQREKAEGNYGEPYTWWENNQRRECFAYHAHFYAFRLMDWYGDREQPCFYNSDLNKWDTVYNMPVERLVDCADYLLRHRYFKKMNKE